MSISKDEALANYLEIDVDEVETSNWGGFEAEGAEYIVASDSEADDLAIQSVNGLIDDVGAFGFSDMSTSQIINYYLDTVWFEEAERESNEGYAEDIASESSSDEDLYVNRLHEESVNYGLMEELDLPEEPEEPADDSDSLRDAYDGIILLWEEKCQKLRDNAESEAEGLKYEFAEAMMSDDSVEWYRDNFGEESLLEIAKSNGLVDEDAFAQWVIDTDGRGHILSGYDGEELELEDGLYAYRTN